MSDNPISAALKRQSVRKRIQEAMMETCGQVTDSWGVLSAEEKERVAEFADNKAIEIEDYFEQRLEDMMDELSARGRPYWIGHEKGTSGIVLSKQSLQLTLLGDREQAPQEIYNHQGGFLLILTNRKMGLEEFEQQPNLSFGATAEGPAAAPQAEPVTETATADLAMDTQAAAIEAIYRDWYAQLARNLERLGVPEAERTNWLASDEALRELSLKYSGQKIAQNIAQYGTFIQPPADTEEDSGKG